MQTVFPVLTSVCQSTVGKESEQSERYLAGAMTRMKKHLNTLFVTTQGAYLSKEGETVVVKVEEKGPPPGSVHTIGGIVCFGNVSCSPFLMGFCAENDVGISFLSEHGRFLARVQGPVSGNVLLRREQYRRADDLKPFPRKWPSPFSPERSPIAGRSCSGRSGIMRTR